MDANLIVFLREPVSGRVKTRLGAAIGADAALDFYRALLARTVAVADGEFPGRVFWFVDGDPSGLELPKGPVRLIRLQGGGNLGKRMAEAFSEVFAEYPAPTAIIGSDCPELDGKLLRTLFARLAAGADAAVIPARDGGYAALALAKRFDGVFEGVEWSSAETLAMTLEKLRKAGLETALLPPLGDIDGEEDLTRFAEVFTNNPGQFPEFARIMASLGLTPGAPPSVVDDLGRTVVLDPPPRHIASLVPSVTETVFDLGCGDRLVARTDYCISPEGEVSGVPTVGGPKSLDLEKLAALAPDLVFADAEENTRAEVEFLIERGMRVFVALPRTLNDVCAFLRRAGRLLRNSAEAEKAATELEVFPKSVASRPAVCLIWLDPPMAVSAGTLPGALMEAAGFSCLIPVGSKSYPAMTVEEVRSLAPRYLLLPSEPYPFTPEEAKTLGSATGATPLLFPGEWVTWYTTRTAGNLREFAALALNDLPPELPVRPLK